MSPTSLLSWWLVPIEPAYCVLGAEIARLSRQFGVPAFDPHITLGTAPIDSPNKGAAGDTVLQRMAQLVAAVGPISVQLRHAAHGPALFKTLYLDVEPNEPLLALHRLVCEALQHTPPVGEPFEPHISLLYKCLPEHTRSQLAQALDAWSGRWLACATVRLVHVQTPGIWTSDNFSIAGVLPLT